MSFVRKREKDTETEMHRWKKACESMTQGEDCMCDYQGRYWSYGAEGQGTPRTVGDNQKLGDKALALSTL